MTIGSSSAILNKFPNGWTCEQEISKKEVDNNVSILYTKNLIRHDLLAQLVEHLTFNQGVDGSSPSWVTISLIWPVGQAVKTPPFHGGIKGSIPLRVTNPGRLAQPGERLPYKQDVGGSIPSSPTNVSSQRRIRNVQMLGIPITRAQTVHVGTASEACVGVTTQMDVYNLAHSRPCGVAV